MNSHRRHPVWALAVLLGGCSGAPVEHPADVACLISDNCCPAPPVVRCDPVHGGPMRPTPLEEFRSIPTAERPPPPAEPGAYRIGIGDVLSVTVPGQEAFKGFGETVKGDLVGSRVKEDGKVYLPLVGGIDAAGKTILEVQEVARERLSQFVRQPFVDVDVIEYRSQKFFVLGAVQQPRALPVDGRIRVVEAVALAGGLKEDAADLENAYVLRQGKVLPISLADALERGDTASNVVLQDSDQIVVPDRADQKVYVFGEVQDPGIVAIPRGRLSLAEALADRGGLDAVSAAQDQIRVFRGGWVSPRAYTLSYHEVHKYGQDILLKPGDRIYVAPTGLATWSRAVGQAGTVLALATSATALAVALND